MAGLSLLPVLAPPAIDAQTAPAGTAGQVRVEDFWIDRYEYPNVEGQLPMVNVTWEEAANLCEARQMRLCTEGEWESACRGEERHLYGYGPQFEPGRCNTPVPSADGGWIRDHGTAPSGAFADCGGDNGARDLIGNVWEWTQGWYDADRGWRVVRGGSWFHNVNFARADVRYGRYLTDGYRLDLIGFRCCRSAGE
jgi:formylglycine-generating enzyme required for sulfatase activity